MYSDKGKLATESRLKLVTSIGNTSVFALSLNKCFLFRESFLLSVIYFTVDFDSLRNLSYSRTIIYGYTKKVTWTKDGRLFQGMFIFLQAYLLSNWQLLPYYLLSLLSTDNFPGLALCHALLLFLIQNLDKKLVTSIGNTPVFELMSFYSWKFHVIGHIFHQRLWHFET